MNTYLFKLGHQPELSKVEIKALFKAHNIEAKFLFVNNNFYAKTESEIDAQSLNDELGGTIFIAKKICDSLDHVSEIAKYLFQTTEGKISFSIHGNKKREALAVKKLLKAKGRSVRYVEPKNTATIVYNGLHKKGTDITIVDSELYATVSVQDINEYSIRDYGKPGADGLSGMLPPKLARLMINIGRGELNNIDVKVCTLLDAFCGSGVVLLEAVSLGFKNILASDISERAIEDTTKNINWYTQKRNKEVDSEVRLIDAQEMAQTYKENTIDLIVSEPYMGKPLKGNENFQNLKYQANDLSELYTNSLREISKILKPGGVVVFLIPTFHHKEGNVVPKFNKIPDSLEYKFDEDALTYHRDGQHLTRVLHILKKQ
mgnify:CR=1 FL=1